MSSSERSRPSEIDLWLAEYREVIADHRHYEVLRWTIVGLTYPAAFAAAAYAGSRWGFTSGRAVLVLAISTLWILAGSLVFAQVRFIDQARMCRAWELENKAKLGFANISHSPFAQPDLPKHQPWYTKDLAWWFGAAVPLALVFAWILAGVALLFGQKIPSTPGGCDAKALWAGFALLFIVITLFIGRAFRAYYNDAKKR